MPKVTVRQRFQELAAERLAAALAMIQPSGAGAMGDAVRNEVLRAMSYGAIGEQYGEMTLDDEAPLVGNMLRAQAESEERMAELPENANLRTIFQRATPQELLSLLGKQTDEGWKAHSYSEFVNSYNSLKQSLGLWEKETREPRPEEAPKQEEPKQEEPKQEQPRQGAPKQEQPRQEAPKQEQPRQEAPREPWQAPERKEGKLTQADIDGLDFPDVINRLSDELENVRSALDDYTFSNLAQKAEKAREMTKAYSPDNSPEANTAMLDAVKALRDEVMGDRRFEGMLEEYDTLFGPDYDKLWKRFSDKAVEETAKKKQEREKEEARRRKQEEERRQEEEKKKETLDRAGERKNFDESVKTIERQMDAPQEQEDKPRKEERWKQKAQPPKTAYQFIEEEKANLRQNLNEIKNQKDYPEEYIARILAARDAVGSERGKASSLKKLMNMETFNKKLDALRKNDSFQEFVKKLKTLPGLPEKVDAIFAKKHSHGGELDDLFRDFLKKRPAGKLQNNDKAIERWMPTVKDRVEALQKAAAKKMKENKDVSLEAFEISKLRAMADVQRGGKGLEKKVPFAARDSERDFANMLEEGSKLHTEYKDFKKQFEKSGAKKHLLSGHGGKMMETVEAQKKQEQKPVVM